MNDALLIMDSPIEPMTIKFFTGDKETPILKLCENGDIYIKGKLVENDKEVVEGMREFLGHAQSESKK